MSEEVRTTSSTGGQKGVKASRYDLIPIPALDLLARLYGRGAEKYEEHNWRKGYEWSKSYASAMRHMTLFWDGEDIDEEMGLPHVICAAFHMFTLATFMIEHPEFDDRFRKDISNLSQQINEVVGKVTSAEEDDEGIKIQIKFPVGSIVPTGYFSNPESFGELIEETSHVSIFDPPLLFEGDKICLCTHPQKDHNWSSDDHCRHMSCNCGVFKPKKF